MCDVQTDHRVFVGDSRSLSAVPTSSVELVITSPPYPMVELWDDLFTELSPSVGDALSAGNGQVACEQMHAELDRVWDEVSRILVDGGIACINIGDATRSIDNSFQLFANHARIIQAFKSRDFTVLPDILWRKPTNRGTKFMGSGMVPPNAYVSHEHEYILIFRNGRVTRSFEPNASDRYQAAYFWEERNRWFSDIWTDIRGATQVGDDADARERTGAYPFEIPYRLIHMYSIYGDTVVDPFWGTGTTTLAAMVSGRNSIGSELRESYVDRFSDRIESVVELSETVARDRLVAHKEFVAQQRAESETPAYEAENYETQVVTKQERGMQLYTISDVAETADGYTVDHKPVRSIKTQDQSSV